MTAATFPTCPGGCGTPADFPPLDSYKLRAEFPVGTVTAEVEICQHCAAEAARFPHRAAEIMTTVLATPAKSLEKIARTRADDLVESAVTELYLANNNEDAYDSLSHCLGEVFGCNARSPEVMAVVDKLLNRILRGLYFECVGSAPGDAINQVMGEFE
jgi:hypothetical protein